MIHRRDIRELAELHADEGCALSFYFQPRVPQNKSHREEMIEAKDVIRNAIREAGVNGKKDCARPDLDRIMQVAEDLRRNQSRAKAVFACSAKGFWREFDLPPYLPGTSLTVNRRFHLRPLAAITNLLSRAYVVLTDRQRARLFDLEMGEIAEREDFKSPLPRPRTDGFAGYDGGHVERQYENEALRHFKAVAGRLKELYEMGAFENLIVGCHESIWPEFESQLHIYLKQRLLGRFAVDPATTSANDVLERADRILLEAQKRRRQEVLGEVLAGAQSNGRGAVGLRRVLRSLETGEVQTLLLGDKIHGQAVECTNCGHVDFRVSDKCDICGKPNREVGDIADALIATSARNGIEVLYLQQNAELDRVGNVGALLRFRADQSTPARLAS